MEIIGTLDDEIEGTNGFGADSEWLFIGNWEEIAQVGTGHDLQSAGVGHDVHATSDQSVASASDPEMTR